MQHELIGTLKELAIAVDELAEQEINLEKPNLRYKIVLSDIRTTEFNNYYQAIMRLLATESGSVDFKSLPAKVAEREFEKFKNSIKEYLQYYEDYIVDTPRGKIITREYISTADMSTKVLHKYIEQVENYAIDFFNIDIEKLKKQFDLEKNNNQFNFNINSKFKKVKK